MSSKKSDMNYMDPEVEKFARENKEMIMRLLEEERSKTREALESKNIDPKEFVDYHESKAKETFDEERKMALEFAEYQRAKAQETIHGVISMFADPEFQKHIASAGLEFMMAMDALMKAAPLPDFVKDATGKAQDMRDNVTKSYCDKNPDCKKTQKKPAQKIDIE